MRAPVCKTTTTWSDVPWDATGGILSLPRRDCAVSYTKQNLVSFFCLRASGRRNNPPLPSVQPADRSIVTLAVQNCGLSFEWASESLQSDPELALLAVSYKDEYHIPCGEQLAHVKNGLNDNYDIVMAAVQVM